MKKLQKLKKNTFINKKLEQNFKISQRPDLTDHMPSNFYILLNSPVISHYLVIWG